MWGALSDLLVSGRRNAISCQMKPAKRRLIMRRAPPRSSAEIKTWFIMYPWQASLPRGRKREKKHSADEEQQANNKRRAHFAYALFICIIYIYECFRNFGARSQFEQRLFEIYLKYQVRGNPSLFATLLIIVLPVVIGCFFHRHWCQVDHAHIIRATTCKKLSTLYIS